MAQQQQMTAQIQAQLHRTASEDVCSPMAGGGGLPRMSSMSSVMSAPPRYGHYSPVAVNAMSSPMSVGAQMSAMDQYRSSRHTPGPSMSSMGSSVEDYALNAVASSHDGSNASTDSLHQMVSSMMKNKGGGHGGGGGHFRSPSVHSEGPTGTELTEPPPTAFQFNAVQAAKLRKKRKRKRMRDLERRLMTKDYDAKRKQMRDGLTAWDRFVDLMTPSFCSCSPAQPTATAMASTMMPGKVTVQ